MKYDFDKPVERRGTGTVKYGMLKQMFGRDDLLPLWVADMDFETPPFIVNALRKRMEHPVFGYTVIPETYWATVAAWLKRQHQWTVDQKWMAFIPGIVKGIGMAVNVFTEPGDKIIIQPPVYHPFRLTPQGNGREVVFNPLKQHEDGSYEMDFENLAEVADDKCKLLILSNPHNPAGLVWSKETLMRLADFCHERGIIVIADEIHCDMPLFGHHHTPFAMVSDKAAQCSITFGAPSKTFNIAGIVSSYAIVPNDSLRRRFFTWLEANEFSDPTMFATIATEAAFTDEGDEWRKQMLRYVEQNILFVEQFCRDHMPAVKPMRPEASFLVWLDCRALNLSHDALIDLFVNKAHLGLNDGEMFGQGGQGHMRLNVGTQRSVLEQALNQLAEAVKTL